MNPRSSGGGSTALTRLPEHGGGCFSRGQSPLGETWRDEATVAAAVLLLPAGLMWGCLLARFCLVAGGVS